MNYVHLSKKAFQNVFPRYFWQFLVFLFAHLWQFFVFCICVFVATFCVNLRPFKMCFLVFLAIFCPGLDFRRLVAVEIRTSAFLFSTAAALVALTV